VAELSLFERARRVRSAIEREAQNAAEAGEFELMSERVEEFSRAVDQFAEAHRRCEDARKAGLDVSREVGLALLEVGDLHEFLMSNRILTTREAVRKAAERLEAAVGDAYRVGITKIGASPATADDVRLLEELVAGMGEEATAVVARLEELSDEWRRTIRAANLPDLDELRKLAQNLTRAWTELENVGIAAERLELWRRVNRRAGVPLSTIGAEELEWLKNAGIAAGLRVSKA
jgi:hypothetical protein